MLTHVSFMKISASPR